jgi:carbonic anhydrase
MVMLVFHPSVMRGGVSFQTKKASRAGGSIFSYDTSARNGPARWNALNIEENECGGRRNSPINVETKAECDQYAEYSFQVRNHHPLLLYSIAPFSPLAVQHATDFLFRPDPVQSTIWNWN